MPEGRCAVAELAQLWAERVGDARLEPAVGARAHAAENDAATPRLAERAVDPVDAPDREHVRGVAAADVDHVLLSQVFGGILRHPEQRQVTRVAVTRDEGLVEADDPFRVLCACCR